MSLLMVVGKGPVKEFPLGQVPHNLKLDTEILYTGGALSKQQDTHCQ
jgi:hypothetical protein